MNDTFQLQVLKKHLKEVGKWEDFRKCNYSLIKNSCHDKISWETDCQRLTGLLGLTGFKW